MADKRKDRSGLKVVKTGEDGTQILENVIVQNLLAEFKARLLQVVDSSEQVIIVGVTGGYVNNVIALDPDRHRVMGALADALDLTAYGDDQPD